MRVLLILTTLSIVAASTLLLTSCTGDVSCEKKLTGNPCDDPADLCGDSTCSEYFPSAIMSCVSARMNPSGETYSLSLRSSDSVVTADELSSHVLHEGAFFADGTMACGVDARRPCALGQCDEVALIGDCEEVCHRFVNNVGYVECGLRTGDRYSDVVNVWLETDCSYD